MFDTVEKEGNTSAPTIYNTVGKNRREKALWAEMKEYKVTDEDKRNFGEKI